MEKKEIISKACAKYVRVSPRKARLVLDLVRGESVNKALVILANLNKKSRVCVEKLVKSALSNAQRNPSVKAEDLFISKIVADKGPMLKRFRAAAMGRSTMLHRKTTHLKIELAKK